MTLVKRLGHYLLQKSWHAGLVAFLFSATPTLGLPLVAWPGEAILALVTLRNGWRDGGVVLLFLLLVPLCFNMITPDCLIILHQVIGSDIVLFLFALLLRKTASWSCVLESALWVGLVFLIIVHSVSSDLDAWWYQKMNQVFVHMTSLVDSKPYQAQHMLETELMLLTSIATGFSTAWTLMLSLINLSIGRLWQSKLFNPGQLRPELLSIRLGVVSCMGFFATLAIILFLGVPWDFAMPFLAAFIAAGLSMIHYFFDHQSPKSRWRIIMFYVALIVLSPYLLGLVILVALNDSVLNLRKRLIKKEG